MIDLYDAQHDFDVIDVHHHVGKLASFWTPAAADEPMTEAEQAAKELEVRLEIMDRQQVRQAIVIGDHTYERPDGLADTRAVNDGIAAYRDAQPDRFPAAVGVVEPLYGERGYAEIERCASELGLIGVSFHTRFQGVAIDSPYMFRYVEKIIEAGMTPFIHAVAESDAESLWQLERIAQSFSGSTILVLDGFSSFERLREAVDVIERNPNLVFDTALTFNFAMLVPLIERFGADRFVYGSDVYSWPVVTAPTHLIPQILASSLDDGAKAAVLGGTLRKALGL